MKPERPGDSQRLLLVNYHYVRDRSQYEHPGIYPVEMEELDAQVRYLRDKFHMATPAEVTSFLRGEQYLPGPSIFLTFDDGLVEHPDVARKILDSYDIKAAFFVCSRPYLNARPLTVHKIHWLRATTEPGAFLEQFFHRLPDEWHGYLNDKEVKRKARSMYVYDDAETGVLKYVMNFVVDTEVMDRITDDMVLAKGLSLTDFCDQVYMSTDSMEALSAGGHVIGSHGHSHVPLSTIGRESGIRSDLDLNVEFISRVTGIRPRWLSYPYGREWAIPENETSVCEHMGYDVALSLIPGWNRKDVNPFRVRRINCNDIDQYC